MKKTTIRNNTKITSWLRIIALGFAAGFFFWGCQPQTMTVQSTHITSQTPFMPQDTETPLIPPAPSSTVQPTSTPRPAHPQQFPDVHQAAWVTVMQGFSRPLDIQSSPGYPDWLFVVEKSGRILKVNRHTLDTSMIFLDIQDRVGAAGDEQGLLGMTFAPTRS